jgi:hypothetical protein
LGAFPTIVTGVLIEAIIQEVRDVFTEIVGGKIMLRESLP